MQASAYVEFFLVSIETVTICDVAACCSFRFVVFIMIFLSGLIALDFLVLLLVVDTICRFSHLFTSIFIIIYLYALRNLLVRGYIIYLCS